MRFIHSVLLIPTIGFTPLVAADFVSQYFQEPFRIEVGGVPLDVADQAQTGGTLDPGSDQGHASPCFVDLYGRGTKDLVVGSFSGHFRVYRNIGTNNHPKFDGIFTLLKAGDIIAGSANGCCVSIQPNIADIDNDGIPDLTYGAYFAGVIYWCKGLGRGQFATRQMLTLESGIPIIANQDWSSGDRNEPIVQGEGESIATTAAWGDWAGDGRPTLILGNEKGEIFLYHNMGASSRNEGAPRTGTFSSTTPIGSQPTFSSTVDVIRIDNGPALGPPVIANYHVSPTVAPFSHWKDNPKHLDILAGAWNGAVYLFKMRDDAIMGTSIAARRLGWPRADAFTTRETLLPPGQLIQFVERGKLPHNRGICSYLQVVDWNGDGKPDLLVGDFVDTMTPRADLSKDERKQLDAIRDELTNIYNKLGAESTIYPWWAGEGKNDAHNLDLREKAEKLESWLATYLEKPKNYDFKAGEDQRLQPHGYIWIYLHK